MRGWVPISQRCGCAHQPFHAHSQADSTILSFLSERARLGAELRAVLPGVRTQSSAGATVQAGFQFRAHSE